MQCLTGTETLGQLLAGAPLQPKRRPTEPKVVLQLPDSPELAAGWVEVACTVYRTRKLLLAPQQQRDLPTHICAHNRWRAASDDNSAMPPAKIPTRKDPPTLRVRVPPDPWSAEDDRKLAKFVAESTWNSWSPYPTDKAWQHIDWRDIAESMIPRTRASAVSASSATCGRVSGARRSMPGERKSRYKCDCGSNSRTSVFRASR